MGSTPLSLRPDHQVVIKHIQKFENFNSATGYFDAYQVIKPFNILANSSYAPLLQIYESLRVTRVDVKSWMGNTSVTTPGYTASMYFRDVLTVVPNRFVEQLIVEPGSKRGRPVTVYHNSWRPIEPNDYEFYDHAQAADMDSSKYGQVNYAGASFGSFDFDKPLMEFTIWYDFKSLVKPEAPPSLAISRLSDNKIWPDYESDVEVIPEPRPNTPYNGKYKRSAK
jgi:hypothetical protein